MALTSMPGIEKRGQKVGKKRSGKQKVWETKGPRKKIKNFQGFHF
jgi:hypothetical protein